MAFTFETVLGIAMVFIGMGAFAFVLNAKNKFPEGTELRGITSSFIPAIIFLILFSLWHTTREVFELKKKFGEGIEYPEYVFISIAYIMLFLAAKKIYTIAKKFGITK